MISCLIQLNRSLVLGFRARFSLKLLISGGVNFDLPVL